MEADEIKEAKKAGLYIMLASLCFGVIFHILGLWFDISVWFERICCFGLFGGVIGYLLGSLDTLDKLEQFKFIVTFLVCIAMAFAIEKNYEQVDRERTEKENKFQQECIQQANEKYPCKDSRDWGCEALKESYIKACEIAAIDWRDTEITVAFNTIDKMAGTLAIGTAIILDGIGATLGYPIVLLLKGKDAKFGGGRRAQDLVIKVGLYKVPSEIAFDNSNESAFDLFNKLARSNIFITLCFVAMCIYAVCTVHIFCQLLFAIFIRRR